MVRKLPAIPSLLFEWSLGAGMCESKKQKQNAKDLEKFAPFVPPRRN